MIIKANQFEAVGHDNPLPDEVIEIDRLREAVPQLRKQIGAPVCVTRGAAGMIVSDPEVTLIPGVKLTGPTDPTGAGDSATAGSVLALSSGAHGRRPRSWAASWPRLRFSNWRRRERRRPSR